MNPQDHEKAQSLLGAYAVNALDDDEWTFVDDHLRACDICRPEADELVETASIIGSGVMPTVPDWETVRDAILGTQEEMPPVQAIRPRREFTRVGFAVAASLLILVGALVGGGIATNADRTEQIAAPSFDQLLPDGASTGELRSPNNDLVVEVAMTKTGDGFIDGQGLPALSEGRTYQLWAVVDGQTISAGVLGSDPNIARFTMKGAVSAFALTEENGTGVPVSANPPVVSGTLTT